MVSLDRKTSRLPFVRTRFVLAALLMLGVSLQAAPRPEERGFPTITVYPQRTHRGGPQTFDVAQDNRGILYFGNLAGLLTFDGAWWRMVKLPNDASADVLYTDPAGRLAIGGVGEIGYLDADAAGSPVYRSLSPLLPPSVRDFGDVRSICHSGDEFVFVTHSYIFGWKSGTPRVIADLRKLAKPPRGCWSFAGSTWLSGETGLHPLDVSSGRILPSVPAFAGRRTGLLVPLDAMTAIVFVRDQGLYTLSAGSAAPFSPQGSAWLKNKVITGGTRLHDGRVAITTRENGVILIERSGAVDQIIDASAGLPDSVLAEPFADREGALWLAYEGPLVRIDLASPVSVLDKRRGLRGSVGSVERFDGRLFVGTSYGMYELRQREGDALLSAQAVPGVPSSVWSLVPVGEELFIGTSKGLWRLTSAGKPEVVPGTAEFSIGSIHASKTQPGRVWVAVDDGIGYLEKQDGQWKWVRKIAGGRPYVSSIVERGSTLWCGTIYDGVLRIDNAGSDHPTVRSLRDGEEIGLFEVGGRMLFIPPDSRIYELNAKGELVPDHLLGHVQVPGGFFRIAEDGIGNLWLNSIPPRMVPKRYNGTYAGEAQPIVQVDATDIQALKAEPDGVIWFGSDSGLYRYEPSSVPIGSKPPLPLIQRVEAGRGGLLFGGAAVHGAAPSLDHSFGRLRFEFAPASYRPGVQYQYWLEPADAEWSKWTDEPFVDYTNLSEGTYTLHVRTRGASGVSGESTWSFNVKPPWYRSPWAAFLWLALAMITILLIVRLRTRALTRDAEQLRSRVAERTDELRQTVEQLRNAQEELVEKNELLARANVRLEKLSLVDELTGLSNRRSFQRALADEWNRAMRRRDSIALLLLDLDHFKKLNDHKGHPAGDAALREIGGLLSGSIRRAGDVVARYGGEEFAVLLPSSSAEEAMRVGEMLRTGIERLGICYDTSRGGTVTVSCGAAALVPDAEQTTDTLIEMADRALYAAKNGGRNRVSLSSGSVQSWMHATVEDGAP